MDDWERYLERFTAWGAEPTVDGYIALFDPDATLQHPGMTAPITGNEIRAFIERGMALLTDYRLVPTNWAARGDTIFIEARQSARIAGREIVWPEALCIKLRGDRVLTGGAYYDPTIVRTALAESGTGQAAHV
jgi:ketosteroid isomerase-like protein